MTAHAQTLPTPDKPIVLWPAGKMPGVGASEAESDAASNTVLRVTNVSVPTITVYPAAGSTRAVPAVIICPGGGYNILAYDLEGTEVAAWLNSLGITSVLLKYRVPQNRDGAFADVQRAIRLVRQNAKAWKIDPDKVGVLGFSAGGHLSARLSTNGDDSSYADVDEADKQSTRPDFNVLVYPAYLADDKGAVAPELPITSTIPPTFFVQGEDDLPYVTGTKVYLAALQGANIPVETFFVAKAGHGYGLRSTGEVKDWPVRAAAWLKKIGVL